MSTFGLQHSKVKSIKSNPPLQGTRLWILRFRTTVKVLKLVMAYLISFPLVKDKARKTNNFGLLEQLHFMPDIWSFENGIKFVSNDTSTFCWIFTPLWTLVKLQLNFQLHLHSISTWSPLQVNSTSPRVELELCPIFGLHPPPTTHHHITFLNSKTK